MPTLLVTGANRGLGLEIARQFSAEGWCVHACCRDPGAAVDLAAIEHSAKGRLVLHPLDVDDFSAVDALARALEGAAIDVLINNAGISRGRDQAIGGLDYEVWMEVLRTNTLAPLKVSEALADNVEKSDRKLIVVISSDLASLGDHDGRLLYFYRTSKVALNMIARSMAEDFRARGVTVLSIHPGWVQTDMGGPNAPVPTSESVAGIKQIIDRAEPHMSGQYLNWKGEALPW